MDGWRGGWFSTGGVGGFQVALQPRRSPVRADLIPWGLSAVTRGSACWGEVICHIHQRSFSALGAASITLPGPEHSWSPPLSTPQLFPHAATVPAPGCQKVHLSWVRSSKTWVWISFTTGRLGHLEQISTL